MEVPYDHYIVDDWPDRRTHIHDSGVALETLVTDGTPVPVRPDRRGLAARST